MKQIYTDKESGQQYEVKAYTTLCGTMIVVYISELHPKRKIFKKTYLNRDYFWIENYDTIEDGILYCLNEEVEFQKKLKATEEKKKEFFKKTIDKLKKI